eukprot:494160-Amphidinium_carterae.2
MGSNFVSAATEELGVQVACSGRCEQSPPGFSFGLVSLNLCGFRPDESHYLLDTVGPNFAWFQEYAQLETQEMVIDGYRLFSGGCKLHWQSVLRSPPANFALVREAQEWNYGVYIDVDGTNIRLIRAHLPDSWKPMEVFMAARLWLIFSTLASIQCWQEI